MPFDEILSRQSGTEVVVVLAHDHGNLLSKRVTMPPVAWPAALARDQNYSAIAAQPLKQ